MNTCDRCGKTGRCASAGRGDAGFTLVEMIIAVVVVLVMAGAALLAAPGIIAQARQASCDAMAGSIANAITASFAHYQNYAHTGGQELITDGYLVDVPVPDYFEIGSPTESAVTVEVGTACSGSSVPAIWAGQLVDGVYTFGATGEDDEPVEESCADGGVCEVGDTGPGGGTVVYAAPSVQSWGTYIEAADPGVVMSKEWGCYGTDVSGATGAGLGAGKANTEAILAAQSVCEANNSTHGTPQAAVYADGYQGTDGSTPGWYLPSEDELNLVCLLANGASNEQISAQIACSDLSLFSVNGYFWSSSQFSSNLAWFRDFGDGSRRSDVKFNQNPVWPVRAF